MSPQNPPKPASIQAFAPKAAPYKVGHGKGLYLLIQPNGKRYWRFRYRWGGKQNDVGCGVHPDVDLSEACAKRDAFRKMLADGTNPSDYSKSKRTEQAQEHARQVAAMRFLLDSDGALSFHLGNRRMSLSPAETSELRTFLKATAAVIPRGMPCL